MIDPELKAALTGINDALAKLKAEQDRLRRETLSIQAHQLALTGLILTSERLRDGASPRQITERLIRDAERQYERLMLIISDTDLPYAKLIDPNFGESFLSEE